MTDNDQFACVPSESFIAFEPLTLANPINTSYTFEVLVGEDQIDITISFDHSSITDSLFFNLELPSCDFIYDVTDDNGFYILKLKADNVCKSNDVGSKRKSVLLQIQLLTLLLSNPMLVILQLSMILLTLLKSYFDELAETCSSPAIQWQISGNESVDWVIDSLTLDADTFEVTFLSTGSYDVTLITENSCGIDTITKNVIIEESPLADIGIEGDNNNLCSPDDAIMFLTDETYLNPDTTSYLISIYAGEDNLISSQDYTQSSLPAQELGVLLDSINSSSCSFTYDDTYLMVLIKLNLKPLTYVIYQHQIYYVLLC